MRSESCWFTGFKAFRSAGCATGPQASAQSVFRLSSEELNFKIRQLLQNILVRRGRGLLVIENCVGCLRLECRKPVVCHQIVGNAQTCLRVAFQNHSVFWGPRAEGRSHIFEIRDRPWTTKDRDHWMSALQSVDCVGVAAGRVAHKFDCEFRLDRRTVRCARRPRKGDAKQSAIEQKRVRGATALRKAGAIRSIDGGKNRVLSGSLIPAFANRPGRQAHAVLGLMARDTGAAILSKRNEERVTPGFDGAVGIQYLYRAAGVGVARLCRQRSSLIH